MAFFVFDLDGTLAKIEHRRHFMLKEPKDYRGFYAACDMDLPNEPVIAALKAHLAALHRVEIWSGRSDEVRAKTNVWLGAHGISPLLLTRMRDAGDFTKDHVLKKAWLDECGDARPDAIYDDRQSVVDMWRKAGVACFQVDPGDWDKPALEIIKPGPAGCVLTLLVGPSGAGKSLYAEKFSETSVISTDDIRGELCGNIFDQSRNREVFEVVARLAKARLTSGLSTVIDATHLRRKTRLEHAGFAPEGMPVAYIVIDRPLSAKKADGGWRNGVMIDGVSLIDRHDQQFRSQAKDILAGDGLPNVTVFDKRELEQAA